MTDYETITYKVEDNVATVTFNRPEVFNAFNKTQIKDATEALALATEDDDVRVVIIRGAGGAFSAGADLSDADPSEGRHFIETLSNGIILPIINMPKTVIAAVRGPAAGAGCSVALACDQIIMTEDSYMMQAFTNIGLVPDCGASWFLAQIVGYRRAYEFITLGQKIPAAQCVDIGLANKQVPDTDFEAELGALVDAHKARPPLAISAAKQLLHQSFEKDLEWIINAEADAQARLSLTADAYEGFKAFVEKRKPVFTGK